MTTPHIHSEWEKDFDEIIGEIPDDAIMAKYGRETCVMCGHPTRADEVVKEIKAFIEKKLTLSKKEAKEEVLRDLYKWCKSAIKKEDKTFDQYWVKANLELYAKQQGIELNKD